MAQRTFVTHPIVVRRLTVLRVNDVTDHMRRVTLGGQQLGAFERDGLSLAAFASTAFDDHVKLVFASDGNIEAALPVQLAHTVDWPHAPHREMRDYTPRRFDAVAGELDLDFVRHGDGPAANWAESAAVGDTLHIAGPKSSLVMPADVDWVILAGDETALPAIGRYLEERPSDAPVRVVVELRNPAARQQLALRPDDTITWVDTAPAAPSALAEAMRAMEWLPGVVYAWAAAESSALLPVRRWLSRERGVSKTHINVTGYWHAPALDDTATTPDAAPGSVARIDPALLLSPVPWFATRAALSTGLFDAVADRPRAIAALAVDCGLNESATHALVDYLVSIDVFVITQDSGSAVALGLAGEAIVGDEHLLESFEDTIESRALLAMADLAPALSGGASAFERRHGHTLLAALNADPELFEEYRAEAGGFEFVVRGMRDLEAVRSARHVAVSGVGSVAIADALRGASAVTVVEAPSVLNGLRTVMGEDPATLCAEWPETDLAVSALALAYRSESEAIEHLTALASGARSALIVEELDGEGLGPPDIAAHRLVDLAASGTAIRSAADIERLAIAAGWKLTRRSSLGWNYEVFELRR